MPTTSSAATATPATATAATDQSRNFAGLPTNTIQRGPPSKSSLKGSHTSPAAHIETQITSPRATISTERTGPAQSVPQSGRTSPNKINPALRGTLTYILHLFFLPLQI